MLKKSKSKIKQKHWNAYAMKIQILQKWKPKYPNSPYMKPKQYKNKSKYYKNENPTTCWNTQKLQTYKTQIHRCLDSENPNTQKKKEVAKKKKKTHLRRC